MYHAVLHKAGERTGGYDILVKKQFPGMILSLVFFVLPTLWTSGVDSVQPLSPESKKLIEIYHHDYHTVKKFYSCLEIECIQNHTFYHPDGSVKNQFLQSWHVYRLGDQSLRMDSHISYFDGGSSSDHPYRTVLITPKGWSILDSQDGKTYRLKSFGKETAESQGLIRQVPFLTAPYSSSQVTSVFLFGDFLTENKSTSPDTFVSKVLEFKDENGEAMAEITSNIPILKSWITIVKKSDIWVNKKIVSEFIEKTTKDEKPDPFGEIDFSTLSRKAKSKQISTIEYQKESASIPLIRSMEIMSLDPQGSIQWVSNYQITKIVPGPPDNAVFDADQLTTTVND